MHIEDDKIIRFGWISKANDLGIKLNSFSSCEEFEENNLYLNQLLTTFYIDSDLGESNIDGVQFSKKLYDRGYRDIYLTTGYDYSNFKNLYWLKGIIEKGPPW